MAVNEFGDTIIEQPVSQEINEFGDPIQVIQEGQVLPQFPLASAPITAEQQSINEFIRSRQAGPISRAASSLGGLLNTLIVEPVKAVGAVPGQIMEVLGRTSVVPANESPVKTALFEALPLGARAVPELAQTGLEAGGRALFSLGDVINQLVNKATTAASDAIENPLQAAVKTGVSMSPLASLITQLAPSTPDQEDINQFLQDQQRARQIEAVLSQPVVPEVIGEANIPLAENVETIAEALPIAPPALRAAGRAVSAAPRAIGTGARVAGRAITSPIQTGKEILSRVAPTISERVAPVARLKDATISSLRLGADELDSVLPKVPNAVERTLQTTGKIPETAEEAVLGMKDSRKRIYGERLEFNNAAKKQGLKVDFERSLREAEDVVNSRTNLSPEKKKAQIKELRDTYSGQKDPIEGQSVQEDLNQELSDAYANETIDKNSLVAKKAFRDSVAGQMDDIGQAVSGIADSSYRDIGNLIEVEGRLRRAINEIIVDRADAVTGIGKSPKSLPTTKVGAVSRTVRGALSPLRKTQLEKLNDNVRRVFSEQPTRPPVLPIEPGVLRDLRASQTPTAESLIESQIREKIQGYPPNIRSDPALARLVAESELGLR